MKRKNSQPEQAKTAGRDFRYLVLLGFGLALLLADLAGQYNPGAGSISQTLPAHLKQISSSDRMRPLFFLPVKINSADAELLETIPGIGPSLAQKITHLRKERNGIRSLDELLDVQGIGPATLAAIKPYCTL